MSECIQVNYASRNLQESLVNMKKETKKEIVGYISLALAIFSFIIFTIFWAKTPMKEMFFELMESSKNQWWSETLVAGTLGMIGVGMFAMMLYPAPILAILVYSNSKKWMVKKWKL